MATAAQKIEAICRSLQTRGEPGNQAQVARLLNVSPSTVHRWMTGVAVPKGRQAEALNLLYNTVCEAQKGNPQAKRILGTLMVGAGASLLGLGVGGFLMAAGLGWALGETKDDNA